MIRDDVGVYDNIDELMLLLMIMLIWDNVDVENDIEMGWCWEWHWDEMILMSRITLRWNDVDVDVENEIKNEMFKMPLW